MVSLFPPFHLCLFHSVTASELLCPFSFPSELATPNWSDHYVILSYPHALKLYWTQKILQLITPLPSPAPFFPFLFPFLFFFSHTSTCTLLNPAQRQRPVSRNYDKTQQLWLHKEGTKERKERGREVKRGEIEPLETWYLVWTSSRLWCCKWALHQEKPKQMHASWFRRRTTKKET